MGGTNTPYRYADIPINTTYNPQYPDRNMKSIRRLMLQHLLLFIAVIALLEGIAFADDDGSTAAKNTDKMDDVDTKDFEEFLMACSQGDIDKVKEFVQKDTQYYVTAYSKNGGESCLHVAGILGQATVTRYILQHGGNPDQRSQNIQHGLRMTPLSWNVYGNHIENVQLLLQAGATVNLDFDYMVDGTLQKVTVFDLLLYINSDIDLENSTDTEDETNTSNKSQDKLMNQKKARSMRDLLLQYSAKRYSDFDEVYNDDSKNDIKVEL